MSNYLPDVDWVELYEPFDNQTRYVSLSTSVYSDKRPLNVEIKNAYDFDWWKLLDSKSNKFYYFNTSTRETTWIKPQSNSIISFSNVQINSKEKFQRSISKIVQPDINSEFMKARKVFHYGTAKRSNDVKTIQKPIRPPVVHSLSTEVAQSTNASLSPSSGKKNSLANEISTKFTSHCRLNDNATSRREASKILQGLSSTPSIKHRPFPRTNPRSVPRRGESESSVTYPQESVNKTTVRRKLSNNEFLHDVNSSQSISSVLVGASKTLTNQQWCNNKNSLSGASSESIMNTSGVMCTQGLLGRKNSEAQKQELSNKTLNMNNGFNYPAITPINSYNGFPPYDYPPTSNNYYMTHQNSKFTQQQSRTGKFTSQNLGSQPETFCLRRPQSEQSINVDMNKKRMNMVSSPNDILSGILQTGRYYRGTMGGFTDRPLSPTSVGLIIPQYRGPLPGWNSELFRKDQPLDKLLKWSKESIQKPLLISTDKILKSDACRSFKQIQGFMGDRKSKYSPTELVNFLIKKGMKYYPLRDEIFMQICKQATNNPDDLSTLRGWELLRSCLNCFSPSPMFRPYLEGYVLRHMDNTHSNEYPTPQTIQHAAEQILLLLSRPQNSTITMDPSLQFQQSQQMSLINSQHTLSVQKNWPVQLFESRDNSEDSSSQKNLQFASHFGFTLDDIMRAQYLKFPNYKLPWILVTLCKEIIKRNGHQTEGIFRIAADSTAVQAMSTVLDLCESLSENPLTCDEHSPHTPAFCVKRWLDSLLEPLVLPSICTIGQDGHMRTPTEIFQYLSPINQATLMYLIWFLQFLSLDINIRLNRMGPWNLAVALAPNVFQLDPGSSEYSGSRSSKKAGGSSGLDTCRSDNSTNESSGSSSRGCASADDSFRPHIKFLYHLIVGLDTSSVDGII